MHVLNYWQIGFCALAIVATLCALGCMLKLKMRAGWSFIIVMLLSMVGFQVASEAGFSIHAVPFLVPLPLNYWIACGGMERWQRRLGILQKGACNNDKDTV